MLLTKRKTNEISMDEEEKMPLDKKDVEEKEYLNKQLKELQQRVEKLKKDAMK